MVILDIETYGFQKIMTVCQKIISLIANKTKPVPFCQSKSVKCEEYKHKMRDSRVEWLAHVPPVPEHGVHGVSPRYVAGQAGCPARQEAHLSHLNIATRAGASSGL